MNYNKIVKSLEERLPEIARSIIRESDRLPPAYRQQFLTDPDGYEEHKPRWHQWGILTHSRKFYEMYHDEAVGLLDQWGLEGQVMEYMSQEIDCTPKSELIKLAILLHDIGKFDKVIEYKDGKIGFDFKGHEQLSQRIILGEHIRPLLEQYGLGSAQIRYVAECAGKHFELGKIRKKTKDAGMRFTIGYAGSEHFRQDLEGLLPELNGLAVEVGLLYLSDSLSKTDIRIYAESDEEIRQKRHLAEQQIRESNLPPTLIEAALERPVAIAIAKQYLETVMRL